MAFEIKPIDPALVDLYWTPAAMAAAEKESLFSDWGEELKNGTYKHLTWFVMKWAIDESRGIVCKQLSTQNREILGDTYVVLNTKGEFGFVREATYDDRKYETLYPNCSLYKFLTLSDHYESHRSELSTLFTEALVIGGYDLRGELRPEVHLRLGIENVKFLGM